MSEEVELAVKFELDSSAVNWTKFTSPEVELAGFQWFVGGEYKSCGIWKIENGKSKKKYVETNFAIRKSVIQCTPIEGKETSIWSCDAKGEVVAFAKCEQEEKNARMTTRMTHSIHWSHRFSFQNSKSGGVEIDFHKKFVQLPVYYVTHDGERKYSELELRVNVTSHTKDDLAVPGNKTLKSPEDDAKVVVEGKMLWLSKEVLCGASSVFHAYFNDDLKEKRNGEFPLTGVKLDEFMRFVAIIHGVEIDIDKTCLQYLLRLEDKYQCDGVRSKCHARLVATKTLTQQEKLRIGDRYRFQDVIDTAIEKMNIQELTAVGREMEPETYSNKTIYDILKAVSERR